MPDELAKLRGAGGSSGAGVGEALALPIIQRIGPDLRRNQVCHHVAQPDAGEPRVVLLEHRQFTRIESKPRHAGIDVQNCRQNAPCAACHRCPVADFAERAEYRDDVVREIVGFGARDQPAQHSEQRVGYQRADLHGLVQQGDEEVPAAGGVQRLHNGARAETVAICLDHAGDRAGWMLCPEQLPIGDDGGEVDF